jgi:uncharacterized protein
VLVAAVLTDGVARRVVEAGALGRFTMVVCPSLLDELAGVLARPRFERWRSRGELDEFVMAVGRVALGVPDPEQIPQVLRDPNDDYLVALARSADCSSLCSRDHDLLDASLADVDVLSPAELLRRLE